jgi:hypothetical protein
VSGEEGTGAWRLRAAAAELVGTQAGRHELWVVVARPGRLPAGGDLAAGEPAARALGGEGRRAYRLEIELRVPETPRPEGTP